MQPDDSHTVEISLESLWRALAGRTAVLVGAATALCALLADAPVRIACLRGFVAWLGVIALSRMFGYAFREAEHELVESTETEPQGSTATTNQR